MNATNRFFPLITAIGLMVIFAIAMMRGGARKDIPSPLIGKPAPTFELEGLEGSNLVGLSSDHFKGQITLLNFWASWCAPCHAEHPYIMELSKRDDIQIFGINYNDSPVAAKGFLNKGGNPYARLGLDIKGRTGIDFGVYGIPETFIIDQEGIIRYRHSGPITPKIIAKIINPEIEKLKP